MKTFYAFKNKDTTGLFNNDSDDLRKITGFTLSQMKAFSDKSMAEQWLYPKYNSPSNETIYIYTDGSYLTNTTDDNAGAGFLVYNPLSEIPLHEENFVCKAHGQNQILGETSAVIAGINWIKEHGYKNVIIKHDLNWVGEWGKEPVPNENETGANDQVKKDYKKPLAEFRKQNIKISFSKVKSHQSKKDVKKQSKPEKIDFKFNSIVDKLAKNAAKYQ